MYEASQSSCPEFFKQKEIETLIATYNCSLFEPTKLCSNSNSKKNLQNKNIIGCDNTQFSFLNSQNSI